MKNLLLFIFVICLSGALYSQNIHRSADDAQRIALHTYVPEQIEGLTPGARNNLENRLSQIATLNGMGGNAIDARFIITANVVVLSKDITATAPPMHAYTLLVNVYIGDGIEGTLFSSTSIELKGADRNETKAYNQALRNLNPRDGRFKNMVETGKQRILEYYNSQCDFIISEAQAMESSGNYEGAIAKLMSVPEVAKECYVLCMDLVEPIYKEYINKQCKSNLLKATNAWNAGRNSSAAREAGRYLAEINPNADCFNDAIKLNNEISERIKEIDSREWDLILKQQQDEVDLAHEYLNTIKEIGYNYGRNNWRYRKYKLFW